MDKVSLLLVILGAINWGLVSIFQYDVVAHIFGGQGAVASRIVYGLIALAGIWCVSLLFRNRDRDDWRDHDRDRDGIRDN